MQMTRPSDGTFSVDGIREPGTVMDPEDQQIEGLSLAPSLMSKPPPQGPNVTFFGSGLNGMAHPIHHLQQQPTIQSVYPPPEGQPFVSPYSRTDCQLAFTGLDSFMCNDASFPQSYFNMLTGHRTSHSHIAEFQQRQGHSHQLEQQQLMSIRSAGMSQHTFANGHTESPIHNSLGIPLTGSPCRASQGQASLQSPPPLSQPSYSPSTLGPLTPQCPPSPRLSPLPSPQLSTPSDVQLLTDAELLSTPSANNIARFTCHECGIVKKDAKSLQRHITEKHRKPLPGEIKEGWFRCACGAVACHYRKTNHTRHLANCKPHKWMLKEFVCQCLARHSDKTDHIAHYMKCSVGKKPVGRPRAPQ